TTSTLLLWAPLTEQDTQEEHAIRAHMMKTTEMIGCPPCYGFKEYWSDHEWFYEIWAPSERPSDDEKAQATARMEAFKQSPEGRARIPSGSTGKRTGANRSC